MKKLNPRGMTALVALGLTLALLPVIAEEEEEQERNVTLAEVPAAVKATIQREAGDNKIEEIEVETEDGKTVYEAEWKVEGGEREIEIAEDGTVLEREFERKLTLAQLPSGVKALVLQEAGDNEILEIEEETSDGRTVYEAEWMVDGKEVEVKIVAEFRVLRPEGERDVTLDQVPAAVKATILKEAGDNKLEEIEAETKNGRTVYEAEWKVDGKEIEIEVAPNGDLLKREVEDDEEDDD